MIDQEILESLIYDGKYSKTLKIERSWMAVGR